MNKNSRNDLWVTLTPAIFVLLWATGFIGAKYGLPYAEPMTFLVWRFAIVCVILFAISLIMKAPWPKTPVDVLHNIITGSLLHGLYLGGVFWAIARGMPAGISALIVGFQPLITAVFASLLLGEKITARQWTGLLIGMAGLGLVLGPRLPDGGLAWGDNIALMLNIAALAGITFGTIYQKAFISGADLRTGVFLQYVGGVLVTGTAMYFFEEGRIEWSPELIGTMAWLIIALSLGAISLLMLMIRRGALSKVATLFYLVPAVTSLMAWFLFDETLSPWQLAGVGVIMFAVWLATSTGKANARWRTGKNGIHHLLYGLGAILIAWGVSDFALNFSENGVLPLIVTYGGVSNITIGFIMIGLGRCIQLLQNLRSGASIRPVTARLKSIETPEANEPVEPKIAEEIVDPQDDIANSSPGKIIKEGDIRGYPFRIYENGEIELETKSGWHVFKTIEEVQAHISAETSG